MLDRTFTKKRVFTLFFFLLFGFLHAHQDNPFIIEQGNLIDPRAAGKLYEIGSEVKSKLGVNIYIYAKENYGIEQDISKKDKFERIKAYEAQIVKDLNKPYVLMTMAIDHTHVNLLMSDDLKDVINKDDILDGFVIPLLASKDKNSLYSKTSAAILNGYAEIADRLASKQGIELESSIGSSGRVAGTLWKVFMYFLIFGGIVLYTYAIMRKKRK